MGAGSHAAALQLVTAYPSPSCNRVMTKRLSPIFHLIDANIDTAFFSSIARHHDRVHYPVTIGSMAPAGTLQEKMTSLNLSLIHI